MMLFASMRVGSILGIPIRVHWSAPLGFAALPLWHWVFHCCARHAFMLRGLGMGLFAAAVMVQVVLSHELAHCLVARRCGVRTRAIYLHMFGGVALITDPAALTLTPRQEMAVLSAGPASNLCFSLAALSLTFITQNGVMDEVFRQYALINLTIALFNLIPIWPLDGGQLFRSFLLLVRLRPRISDWITLAVSLLLGIPLCYLAWIEGNYWLVFILLLLGFVAAYALAAGGAGSEDPTPASLRSSTDQPGPESRQDSSRHLAGGSPEQALVPGAPNEAPDAVLDVCARDGRACDHV